MIKLIVFDLDGVLIESKELHFHALNRSLEEKYQISIEEHLSTYDGLPTSEKLKLLTKSKGLPINLYSKIKEDKQKHTVKLLKEN